MIRTFYRILVATLALGATLTLSQSVALADVLTFKGPTPSLSLGGEYTSPYVFNINNVSTPVLLACDDFYSNISDGDFWTANRISLAEAGGTNGQGKFAYQSHSQEYYNEAGWLAQQVMSTWSSNPTLSEQYSWAIWEIFAWGAGKDVIIGNSNIGDDTAQRALWQIVANHIFDASVAVQHGADLSDVYVYTPTSNTKRGTVPQEFFFVPEASTPVFLVFNLLALSGVLFLLRRRCLRD
jgi:hypothetical protein